MLLIWDYSVESLLYYICWNVLMLSKFNAHDIRCRLIVCITRFPLPITCQKRLYNFNVAAPFAVCSLWSTRTGRREGVTMRKTAQQQRQNANSTSSRRKHHAAESDQQQQNRKRAVLSGRRVQLWHVSLDNERCVYVVRNDGYANEFVHFVHVWARMQIEKSSPR